MCRGLVVIKPIHEGGAPNRSPSKQTPSELEDAGRFSLEYLPGESCHHRSHRDIS